MRGQKYVDKLIAAIKRVRHYFKPHYNVLTTLEDVFRCDSHFTFHVDTEYKCSQCGGFTGIGSRVSIAFLEIKINGPTRLDELCRAQIKDEILNIKELRRSTKGACVGCQRLTK